MMKKLDLPLLGTVIFLCLFGLLMIFDASSYVAFRDFSDKYYYLKQQTIWFVLGLISMSVASWFDYKKLYALSLPLMLVAIVLLVLVFIPGIGVSVLGAHRWINARLFILQPAEFVKLALAIYLSAWFSTKERGRLPAFLLLLGLVLLLVMLEPDMGTAVIILSEAMVLYFLEGASLWYFAALVPILSLLGLILIKIAPYRAARLSTFLNPDQSLETSSYHVRQILIALGSGGLTGVGLGNSLQKYAYLPESTTDSVFAIVGEEIGFIGCVLLIMLFVFIMWRGFRIASRAKDPFGKLLACGIVTFLTVQTIVNLGAQTGLFPLTGVPLPFISYGGSALIVDMTAIGILLSIGRKNIA